MGVPLSPKPVPRRVIFGHRAAAVPAEVRGSEAEASSSESSPAAGASTSRASSSSVRTSGCSWYAPSPTSLSSPRRLVLAKRYRETRVADRNVTKPWIRLIATMNLCHAREPVRQHPQMARLAALVGEWTQEIDVAGVQAGRTVFEWMLAAVPHAMKDVRLGQRQRLGLVRTIGARLRVHCGDEFGARHAHTVQPRAQPWLPSGWGAVGHAAGQR